MKPLQLTTIVFPECCYIVGAYMLVYIILTVYTYNQQKQVIIANPSLPACKCMHLAHIVLSWWTGRGLALLDQFTLLNCAMLYPEDSVNKMLHVYL